MGLLQPTSPGFTLPLAITYRDDSGPFAIDLTITAERREHGSGGEDSIVLTIGAGTLHDDDKGSFPLDGLELSMRVANDGFEPVEVLNPGVLTEFQQEGLLDAISTYLNAIGRSVRLQPDPNNPALGDHS